MLDQVARTVFLPWRLKLTTLSSAEKNGLVFRQSMLLFIELIVIHAAIYLQNPQVNFGKEVISFLTYKDMGIQQGFVLLPLLVASEWMRIRNELKLGIVGNRQVQIINHNKRIAFFRIGFFAFLSGILNLVVLPEWILVVGFLAFITLLVFVPNKN